MRASVRQGFKDWTAQHEGFTPFMYCDTLNLVTTGIGNLIDAGPNHPGPTPTARAALNNVVSASAMAPAMNLPWRHRAPGWTRMNPLALERVSSAEVAASWETVKRHNERVPGYAQGGGMRYAALTDITLDLQATMNLFETTLTSFDNTLRNSFAGYEQWPADAQYCVLSMAWAMGPNFGRTFTQFKQCMEREDFTGAIAHCNFKGGGDRTNPNSRNFQSERMLELAARVKATGGDRDVCHFVQGIPPSQVMPGLGIIANAPLSTPKKIAVGTIGAVGLSALVYSLLEWLRK